MINKKKVIDYIHNGYPADKWDDEARYAYQLEEIEAGLDGDMYDEEYIYDEGLQAEMDEGLLWDI